MEIASLGFRTDVMLRRLAGGSVTDHRDHLVVRTAQNPTFYWGNFVLVGSLGMDPANATHWRAVFARAFPDAEHVAIGLDGTGADAACLARYRATGLAVEVNTVLAASGLRAPARPPAKADVRPLHSDEDWAQALELSRALAEHPSDPFFTQRRLTEARRLVESGHGAWFGAFVDGRVRCSLGLCSDGGELARYQTVATHPDFRGRGLASWLVFAAGQFGFEVLGAQTLVIVADPHHRAIGLYRALGFAEVEHQTQCQHPA